jgi:flagellar protein FliO/FliZ
LGGEKLHHVHGCLFAVLVISAGLCFGNLSTLSAQTPDPQGDVSLSGELPPDGAPPSAESLFVFGEPSPDAAAPAPTPAIFVALRMVLVLALAAAAIYGLVFFFKRLSRAPEQGNPYLKVLAGAPLGGGSSVSVVALGAQAWLVGTGSGGVSLIAEITDRELVDAMLLEESRRGPGNGSRGPGGGQKLLDFSAILRRLGGGGPADKRFGAEDLRKRRERLKNL